VAAWDPCGLFVPKGRSYRANVLGIVGALRREKRYGTGSPDRLMLCSFRTNNRIGALDSEGDPGG